MQSVKQSLLVLNRASNWRDGFLNVVRLATSEPEHNLEGGRRNMALGQGAMGWDGGAAQPRERNGTRPTWEIRRSIFWFGAIINNQHHMELFCIFIFEFFLDFEQNL